MATNTEVTLKSLHALIDSKADGRYGSHQGDPGCPTQSYNIKYAQFDKDMTDKILKAIEQLQKIVEDVLPIDHSITLSGLYDEQHGIFTFIRKTMLCKDLETAVANSLLLVDKFLKKMQKELLLVQLSETRNLMLEMGISIETTSREKELALNNLITIINMRRTINTSDVVKMLNALYRYVITERKPPMRTFRRVFETMGLICRNYKTETENEVEKIEQTLLNCLESQAKLDFSILKSMMVEGCIAGVQHIMTEFPFTSDSKEHSKNSIYKTLKHFLDTKFETDLNKTATSSKGPQLAGLKLLAQHGSQLSSLIYLDYAFWHDTFRHWVASKNKDLHQIGYQGLSTFYFIMGQYLKGRSTERDVAVFKYFMNYFRETVLSIERSHAMYEVSLSIQGYGDFSGPCATMMQPQEVNNMFLSILQRAEEFLKQKQENDPSLVYLPKYVQALGTIVGSITSVGPQYQSSLQCLFILLFERFPTLPLFAHQGCIEAFLVTFDSLLVKKGSVADPFITEVVYQALIRTCSHVIVMDAEIMKESLTPHQSYLLITYDRFLPEWEGILNIYPDAHYRNVSPKRREAIADKVFSSFIQAVIKLIEKLDLRTREKGGESGNETDQVDQGQLSCIEVHGMDPETSLEACKPKDFQIFVNMVDLCFDLLPIVKAESVLKWMDVLMEKLIVQASQQPLVSGFNKLLTLCLSICESTGYYKNFADEKSRKLQCYQLLGRFLRDVVVGISQFKGDLLLSCIRLLLASPICMVQDLLQHLIVPFRLALKMGLSFLKIASEVVETLAKWQNELPTGTLVPLLLEIVPLFDQFLHCSDQTDSSDAPVELVELQSRKHSKIRVSRRNNQAQAGEKNSALASLQRQILLFLAQLDSPTCLSIVRVEDLQIAEEAISWTARRLLKFNLPFTEMKPPIYLDNFLPLVCKIALTSGDRHTRITACEMLHSSVIFTLGISVQVNTKSVEYSELPKLLNRVIPTIITLGCDSDVLVRQLFQPLVLQIIHYLTNQGKIESKETLILVNKIMDGLTNSESVAIRDFSAVCLKEFVVWTFKQSRNKVRANSQVSLDEIMKKVYMFSKHPCQFKRLGSALAINSLYTILREERLMDGCWLELLYYMVNSLLLTSSAEELVGTQQQTSKALSHIERVLITKSTVFNRPSSTRTVPPEFEGNLLKDGVFWLMNKCSSRIEACRKVCTRLVMSLAKWAVQDATDTSQALLEIFKNSGSDIFIQICEGYEDNELKLLRLEQSQELPTQWISILLGSLECYVWILENNLVPIKSLFHRDCHPMIFQAISDFVTRMLTQLSAMETDDVIALSIREAEHLETLKCKVVISIINFLNKLMEAECEGLESAFLHPKISSLIETFWSEDLLKMMCILVFEPETLAFSLKNNNYLKELQTRIKIFLDLATTKLSVTMMNQLTTCFNRYLGQQQEKLQYLEELNRTAVQDGVKPEMLSFVLGCNFIRDTKFWRHLNQILNWNSNKSGEALMARVFGCLCYEENEMFFISPQNKELDLFLEASLRLAFKLGVSKTILYFNLLNNTPVEEVADRIVTSLGATIAIRLKHVISDFLLKDPLESMSALLASEDSMANGTEVEISVTDKLEALNLVRLLISDVWNNIGLRERFGAKMSIQIMEFFNTITSFENQALLEVTQILFFVAFMMPKESEHCKYVVEWVCAKLKAGDKDLGMKRRCLDVAVPIFSWHEDHQIELMSALKVMKDQSFPLTSNHLMPESSVMVKYRAMFHRLLWILVYTKNEELLMFIASASCVDASHVCKEEIQDSLARLTRELDHERQTKILLRLFDAYDKELEIDDKMGYMDQYLIPILQACDIEVLKNFFVLKISSIWNILKSKCNSVSNIMAFKRQILSKSGCFKFIELMYGRLGHADFQNDQPIGQAFALVCEESMNKMFTKNAYLPRSEVFEVRQQEADLYRMYQCDAYNALVAIICCLYPDVRPEEEIKYSQVLLPYKKDEKSYWEKIIDCSQTINLRMDFQEIPNRKSVLVNIRKDARDHRRSLRKGRGPSLRSQTVQYIISQQLFDSSLSEDVTKFDLSNVEVLSYNSQSQSGKQPAEEEAAGVQEEVFLEMDSINKHSCMPILCALVRKFGTKIRPNPAKLPGWMANLRDKLRDPSTHANIKMFIVKLIINNEDIFRPYAAHWIEHICSTVNLKSLGMNPNYMITDTISMLLKWHDVAVPNPAKTFEALEASSLLSLLMQMCSNGMRSDFLKFFLELVKTMIEVWKPALTVSFQLFFDMICKSPDPKVVQTGLQLTAILVTNKVLPWNVSSEKEFIDNLMEKHFLNSTVKKVQHLAAENIGMILKWAFGPEDELRGLVSFDRDSVKALTIKNLNTVKEQKSIFYLSLHTIFRHHPPIVDTFLSRLLHDYPQLVGIYKTQALDMLCSRLEEIEDKWQETSTLGLDRLILAKDQTEQHLALAIVTKMLPELTPPQALHFASKVSQILQDAGPETRDKAYELLMSVFTQYRNAGEGNNLELKKLSVAGLVRGLSDSDPALQKKVLKFWRANAVDPNKSLPEKFVEWMKILFVNESANLFLGSFLELLLEELPSSPDYNSNLFTHNLGDCHYEDMQLLVSWRTQHATMQPLFVESQTSQVVSQSLSGSGSLNAGYLRATQQTLLFEPTQEKEPDEESTQPKFAVSQSSLLFNILPSTSGQRRPNSSSQTSDSQPHFRTSFRFMSNENQTRVMFAKKEIELRSRRSEVSREHQRKKEGQIRMLRKYRMGDFPDIQIPHSALIKPLQIMAKQDPTLSKYLLEALFAGFCEILKPNEEQHSQFLSNSEGTLKFILENTSGCVPMLLGAIMEISYKLELQLNPSLISEVSSINSLAPLGCLLVEKYIEVPTLNSSVAKRQRLDVEQTSEEKTKWLKLAELYQLLEDRDVVLAIIKRALGDPAHNITQAVEAEALNNWMAAKKYYNNFLDQIDMFSDFPPEYDFCFESYCKCLEKLSKWEDVSEKVKEVSSIGEGDAGLLWSDQWNQEKLLPWYLKSQIFGVLESGDEKSDLTNLFSAWLNTPEYLSVLKNRFSEQVALVCAMNEDMEKSRFYSRLNLQILIEQWSVLSTFLPTSRAKKLGHLQCVSEIIGFADVAIQEELIRYENSLVKLCEKWNENLPKPVDSLLMWETRVEYRSFFAARAMEVLNQTDCENSKLYRLLRQTKPKQELALIDLAIHQNNISVASKFIKNTQKIRNDTELGLRWKVALGKVKWLNAQTKENPKIRLQDTTTAFSDLYKSLMEAQASNLSNLQKASVEGELAEIAWSISSHLKNVADCEIPGEMRSLLELMGADASSKPEIESFFETCGRNKSRTTVELLMSSREEGPQIVDALMKIVHHNRSLLKHEGASEEEELTLTEGLISCLLDAMKFGSKEARMLFPSLLQIDDITKVFSDLFNEKCKALPEWMFLGWLNQILAYIDTEKVSAVEDILLRISSTYGNALTLPFHFTTERLALADGQLRGKTKMLISRIKSTLATDKLTSMVIKAFCSIKQPEIAMRPYIVQLFSKVNANKFGDLKTIFQRMCLELYHEEDRPANSSHLYGDYAYKTVEEHVEELKTVLTPLMNREPNTDTLKNTAKSVLRKILADLNKSILVLKQIDSRNKLADFCPWLAEFQASKFASEVEIPGQYIGDKVPNPKYHIKFSTFEPAVQVLQSMRQPILITCIGNNGQSYPYIVKAGEDLRQDERIQLLFGIMNDVFLENQFCRERQLKIKTYRVIPINARCGIIQFVPNCSSLKDFSESTLIHSEKARMAVGKQDFIADLSEGAQTKQPNEVYANLFTNWSEAKTKRTLEKCMSQMPPEPFKRAFKQLSASNEGFFWLRQNFVSSLATMSVAHWLLGIGDRHRSNMLICQRTGIPVGIDFGHAFGSATQFLGVPELLPFRLTRHLVEMMGPLGTSGTLRATMIHALQALRKDHELLLNAMQVFIQEPSLDWQENAKKLSSTQDSNRNRLDEESSSTETEAAAAFAERKISLATHKLMGALPSLVMEEELKKSLLSQTIKRAVIKLVRGNAESLRAELRSKTETESSCLNYQFTAEQQIDCLIEQATDTHILGKTYWGWEAWC